MTNRQKRVLAVAGAIVVAFLVGFAWQFTRASALARELATTRAELEAERLESSLAAATVHAQNGDYEIARQLASEFFDQAAEAEPVASAPVQAELDSIQAQRDALITLLARANPESSDVLVEHYVRLRVARGGPEAALATDGNP